MLSEILTYTLLGGAARARVIAFTEGVAAARDIHFLSNTATAALGRLLMAGALFGSELKSGEHKLTLTAAGNGPLGRVIVTAYGGNAVKGYVEDPGIELPVREDGKLDVGRAVGTEGHLTYIADLGMREPYISRVQLITGEIAEDIAQLLAVSMQRPAIVALGVLIEDNAVGGAGGIIIEPLPGALDSDIEALFAAVPNLSDISRKSRDCSDARSFAEGLLCGLKPELLESVTPIFECDCSRERMERVLVSMGESELHDIMDTQDSAELVCQFCGTKHLFDRAALERLLKEARG